MGPREQRFYRNVPGLSTLVDQYVLPNGERLTVEQLVGNAGGSPETNARIIWDYGGANVVLFSTNHDSLHYPKELVLMGNGVKILAIVLDNDLLTSKYMGAYWAGGS